MKKIILQLLILLTFIISLWKIINATAPVIDNWSWLIDENSATGTLALTASWSDADLDDLSYDIISWNTGSVFTINNSWAITLSGIIDYETLNRYELVVELTASWETDTWSIIIDINDVNDVAPVITSSNTWAVDENILDTELIKALTFTDEDTVNGATVYTIMEDTDNLFELSSTWILSLQWWKNFDFETKTSHIVKVTINDWVNTSIEQTITININNINESPIIGNFSGSLDDNTATWTLVLTASWSDIDWDDLNYEILLWNTGSVFTINNSGAIILSGSVDFHDIPQYNLVVQVTDSWSLTDTWSVIIDIVDRTAPKLKESNIISNNANSWALAKVWDAVQLTFEFDEEITNIDVKILWNTGSIGASRTPNLYYAYYVLQESDLEGLVSFTINWEDLNWNVFSEIINPTTDLTQVLFDKTAPTVVNSTIISNNTNSWSLAKMWDEITLIFEMSEVVDLPEVYILKGEALVTQSWSSNIYIAKHTVEKWDPDWFADFGIRTEDLAWNIGLKIEEESNVIVDTTVPTIISSTIISNNANSWALAKVWDEISLIFEFDEEVENVDVQILWNTGSITQSWSIYVAKYITTALDSEWIIPFTINAADLAWNDLVEVINSTIDLTQVIFDKTKPVITFHTIESNNTSSWAWAKVWNKLTLTFEFDEEVNEPEVMILNNTGSVIVTQSWTTNIYIAEYRPTYSDIEWKINFSINWSDLAWNIADEITWISSIIFDRTKPNFDMTIWFYNNEIDMVYKVLQNFDDPYVENLRDNFSASWSLIWKVVSSVDFRPLPWPNTSGRYIIVYSVSDVAWNRKTKTRQVWIRWGSKSIAHVPMDICNETNWDHSWDYHDWKCEWKYNLINEEENYRKERKIYNLALKKINDISDIKKYNANEENVKKFEKLIISKYWKIISKFSQYRKNKLIKKMNLLLEKIFNKENLSKKDKNLIDIIIALKQIILKK